MLIHSCSQLVTLTANPQRGGQLGELNIIPDGAILIEGGTILETGPSQEMLNRFPREEKLDAGGRAVIPGLVDAHTHLVWAGDRAAEFEMRLSGRTYMEIMAAGSGIQSTVNATRAATRTDLLTQTRQRASTIFLMGTTSAEAKTGYGLSLEDELKLLEVLLQLDKDGPLEIFPTFLGAHAIPEEFKEEPDAYTELVCEKMLPAVKSLWQIKGEGRPLPFVDVFCEQGAFSLSQSRLILEKAGQMGFPLKIHADEFENLGGASMASSLGAISADHLVKISPQDIRTLASSDTVAVSLPCTPFGLGVSEYSPAQELIKAGALFALASDLNPGTAWCGNLQFTMALACRMMKLTPAQALAAATINASAAINQSARLGSLHPGKQADLLILSVSDYRHLAYRFGVNLVDIVIKKGRVYPHLPSC